MNELPFKLRMVMENTILGGLWFGEAKPNMSTFFKPIFSDLTKLERVGVEVQSCLLPHAFISKVILAGTCDLPAKCMVLNMMQFNENNGCAKCLQPGITYNISERQHTHIYVTGSYKTYLLGTSKLFEKTRFEYLHIPLKIKFFAHLDKATM